MFASHAWSFAVALFAAYVAAGESARAGECSLQQIASLPFTWTEEGRLTIPVGIEGETRNMLFDTGAPASIIDYPTADALSLTRKRIMHGVIFDSSGRSASESARIRRVTLGNLVAKDVQMLVNPERAPMSPEFSGILGAELMQNQDVELDFTGKMINVFSQDHCPGQVVYWPASAVAVVPIQVLTASGHIILPVTLDGEKVDALLDTGASNSFLTMQAAHNRFGLGSSDMAPAGTMNGDPVYKRRFKSLELEGIAIKNPEIVIYVDRASSKVSQQPETGSRLAGKAAGDVDLILGMTQLRHFRIYIAYRERKLYITAGRS
ncbi:MAG: aspartyl protease family protein [Alphaproteobacteria bacterium]